MAIDNLRRGALLYLISDHKMVDFDSLFPEVDKIPLSQNIELDGYAVTFNEEAEPPSWISVLDYMTESEDELKAQRPGALILVKYKGHGFIISLGSGWYRVRLGWYVLNFGKLVALNSIPFNQLSGLKLEQVLATWHQSTEKSPLPTSAKEFGMESDRDLVHTIEGQPAQKYANIFGLNIKGADALNLAINFSNLKSILDNALERYQSSDYKNIWPEFNYISSVSDQSVVTALEDKLNQFLSNKTNLKNLILVFPLFRKVDLAIPVNY